MMWDLCCSSVVIIIAIWLAVECIAAMYKYRLEAEVEMFSKYVDTRYRGDWIV